MAKSTKHVKNSKKKRDVAKLEGKSEEKVKTCKNAQRIFFYLFISAVVCAAAILFRKRYSRSSLISYDDLEYVVSFPNSKEDNAKIEIDEIAREFRMYNLTEEQKTREYKKQYVIVQARRKNTLVCSVFVSPVYYRSSIKEDQKRYPVLEIYCLFVSKKFRGQRLAIKHLYNTLKYLQKVYDLSTDAVVGLHISPLDRDMNKAFALYRISGFTNGEFSKHGPYSYRQCYEKIQQMPLIDYSIGLFLKKKHPNPSKHPKPKGEFLTTFTSLGNIYNTFIVHRYSKNVFQHYFKKGKLLKQVQLEHYNYKV